MLNPDKNIQLGAAYLSQVHGQFNGNRVLASAAYNAGPGRVRQWLKGAKHLSFDVWWNRSRSTKRANMCRTCCRIR